jgi:hypothetical protein
MGLNKIKMNKRRSFVFIGKGHYYKNQNIKKQKEHEKKFKASEHQKASF